MEENPFYEGYKNQVVTNNFGGLSLQSYRSVTSIKEENTRLKFEPFSPNETNLLTMSASNSSFDRGGDLSYGRYVGPGAGGVDASSGMQSRERVSREHSGLLSIPCPPKKRAQGNQFGLSMNSMSSPQDLSMATSINSQGMTNRSIGISSESGMSNVSNVRDVQMYGGPCDVTLMTGELSSGLKGPKNGISASSVSFAPNVSVKTSITSSIGLNSECNMSESTIVRRQAAGGGVDSNDLPSVSGSLVMNLSQGKEDGRKRVHDDTSVSRILTISPVGEGKKSAFETSQVKNGKLTIMRNPLSGQGSDIRRNSFDSNQSSMSSKAGISRVLPSNHKGTGNMQEMTMVFKSGKIVSERIHLGLQNSPMRHEYMGLSGDHGLKGSYRNAMLSVKQEKGTFWPEKPKIDTGNMKSSIVLTNLQRGNIPTIMQTVVEPVEKDIHQKAGHGELRESDFLGSKDIDERDQHRKTPLMWASMFGQAPTVGLLLSRKADVNAIDLSQYTALHFAAAGGHHEIIKMLLSAGAIVDARDCHRNTPLMISVMKNHAHVVNELILSGASLVKLNKSHHNALALAVNYRAKDARLVIENQLRSVMRGMAGKEKNA